MNTIRIEGINFHMGTRVFIDDVEQKDMTRVVFDHLVGKLPYLRIDRYERRDDKYVLDGDGIKRLTEEHNKQPGESK